MKKDSDCKSAVGVMVSIYKDHGVKGLFKGMNSTLLREVPGMGIQNKQC